MLARRRIVLAAAATAASLGAVAGSASAATQPVTESDVTRQPHSGSAHTSATSGWKIFNRDNGTAAFATAPSAPGAAGAALVLSTPGGNDKAHALNFDLAGTPLSELETLSYKTYRFAGSLQQVTSINVWIDANGPAVAGGEAPLIFEPVYNTNQGPVTSGAWQTWDAIRGGAATWWANAAIPGVCAQTCYVPLSTIKAQNPNAVILSLGVNQGGGNPGLRAAVDELTVNDTTYDFDQPAATTTTVSPSAPNGWTLSTLNNGPNPAVPSTGTVTAEAPGTGATLGSSSFRLRNGLGDAAATAPYAHGTGGMAKIYRPDVAGRKLSELTTLRYSTYVAPSSTSGTAVAPTLKLQVFYEGASGYSTLSFEPYMQGNHPVRGTWQTWDALNGKWWGTGASAPCPQASPCSLAQIIAAKPNTTVIAGIPAENGGSGLEITVGQSRKDPGGWDGLDAYVDDVVLGFGSTAATRYDLEADAPDPGPAPGPVDSDGDGITDPADCAPFNASAPSKIGTDANCDGIADETQQPPAAPQPAPQPSGGEQSAPSGNPPASVPTPQQLTDAAQDTLRDTPAARDEDFDLGGAQVFVPTGGTDADPSRRVPVVDGDTVTIDRQAANRGTTQTLMAIAAPDTDTQATVRQTAKIGDRTIELPVQRLTIQAGSTEPVKLPLTKAMRKALRNGQDIELTIQITVVDANGNRSTQTKTYTVKAETPPKKNKPKK